MPPPTARSKQDVGAASAFFGALVTISAAKAEAPRSASAANDAAMVFVDVMTSPSARMPQCHCCGDGANEVIRTRPARAEPLMRILNAAYRDLRARRIRNCCLVGRTLLVSGLISARVARSQQILTRADVVR